MKWIMGKIKKRLRKRSQFRRSQPRRSQYRRRTAPTENQETGVPAEAVPGSHPGDAAPATLPETWPDDDDGQTDYEDSDDGQTDYGDRDDGQTDYGDDDDDDNGDDD